MATRLVRSILANEMVAGTYIERHSFIPCLRRRRCTIEGLGIGRLLLFPFSPSFTFEVRPPELARASSSREGVRGPQHTDRVRSAVRRTRSGKALVKELNG